MTAFSPGPSGYWKQAIYTTINSLLYTLTFGRYLFLEGRRRRKSWRNWSHGERQSVAALAAPTTEAEIVERILGCDRLRIVGSGHSFNDGVRGEAILSLDRYTGIVDDFDHSLVVDDERTAGDVTYVRVRAGTRVRDVNRMLYERGLAVVALPSHDAQSVAGILSTDVHGTGRDVGFVSASVVGLRLIDGRGEVHDVWRGDPLFCAALGGIGAVGVITEVSLRCVNAFRIRQRTIRLPLDEARRDWKELLAAHDHASFYVFPFAEHAQLHTWDRTGDITSLFAGMREFLSITRSALSAAWLADLVAWSRLLPRFSFTPKGNAGLVMNSSHGFNRTIYHLHQELEFAVPAEQVWEVVDHLHQTYERLYREHRMPFTLIELRFTPAAGTHGMISPGAGDEAMVYVNLVCNQSGGFAEFYAEAERYIREIDARPHLGKWCKDLTHSDMARLHGRAFDEFCRLRAQHDPGGRFSNAFTDRVFGPVGS